MCALHLTTSSRYVHEMSTPVFTHVFTHVFTLEQFVKTCMQTFVAHMRDHLCEILSLKYSIRTHNNENIIHSRGSAGTAGPTLWKANQKLSEAAPHIQFVLDEGVGHDFLHEAIGMPSIAKIAAHIDEVFVTE